MDAAPLCRFAVEGGGEPQQGPSVSKKPCENAEEGSRRRVGAVTTWHWASAGRWTAQDYRRWPGRQPGRL